MTNNYNNQPSDQNARQVQTPGSLLHLGEMDQSRIARLLYTLMWWLIVLITVLIGIDLYLYPERMMRGLGIIAAVDFTSLICLLLIRWKYYKTASLLVLIELWMIVTTLSLDAGGIHAHSVVAYLIIIFIASSLLGAKTGLGMAICCGITELAFVYFDTVGFIPQSSIHHQALILFTGDLLFAAIIVIFQYFSQRNTNDAFQRAKHELMERERAEENLRESETHARYFANASFEGIVISQNGIVLEANEQLARMSGYSLEELTGMPILNMVAPEHHGIVLDHIRNENKNPYEHVCVRKDGSRFHVEVRGTKINYHGRNARVTVIRDITDRKQAEEALRDSERKYRELIQNANNIILRWNRKSEIVFMNDFGLKFFRFEEAELIGRNVIGTIVPEFASNGRKLRPLMEEISANPLSFKHVVNENMLRDRSPVWIDWTNQAVYDTGGHLIEVLSIGTDISEQKRSQEKLQDSEIRYRTLIESANDAILMMDDKSFIECNPKALEMFGCTRDQIIGHTPWSFSPPFQYDSKDSRAAAVDKINAVMNGETQFFEWKHCRLDGSMFDAEVSLNRIMLEERAYVQAIVRDVTERKRAEEKIAQQAHLLDVALDAIIVQDMNDHLLYWNRAAEQLYGRTFEEARDMNYVDFMTEEDIFKYDQGRQVFKETGTWEGEFRQRTKSGQERIIQTRWTLVHDKEGTPYARLIINRDMTEKRKLEAQLRRTQRLESLGTLASGIAHDLNNVLAPIMLSVQILQKRMDDPELLRILRSLGNSAKRGSDIVKQVLEFARGTEGEFAPHQLRYLVDEIETFIRETFPKNIELHIMIPKNLHVVMGDSTQLHQILMNLCLNARDAMPNGGHLNISGSNQTIDEAYCALHADAEPGEYAELTVSDDGMGIPLLIQEKIFEPFFTTKAIGKGTGLGLSTVHTIVKDHKGFIQLFSEVGRGTQFKIFLPAIHREAEVHPVQDEKNIPTGNGELVLVIDDELSILQITQQTLEMYGYRAMTAVDGAEALVLLSEKPKGTVRLILTDINMPTMDGLSFIKILRRTDSDVRIIVTSGILSDLKSVELIGLHVQGYLTKPYTSEKLLKTVHEILSQGNIT